MTNIPSNPTYTQRPTPYNPAQTSMPKPTVPNGPGVQFGTTQPTPQSQTYGASTPQPTYPAAPQPMPGQPIHAQAQAYQAVQTVTPQAPVSTPNSTQMTSVQAPTALAQTQAYDARNGNPYTASHQNATTPTPPHVQGSYQGQGQSQGQSQGQHQGQPQGGNTGQELTDRDREFEKEDKKLYHKRTRIVKFATNKTYFEVFNFGFKHGRVAIKMSNYKPQYSEILISLKLGEYFELKDLIMTGAIHQQQPDKYNNLHFYNKGTASKYSKDGSVSARQLGVQRANDPSKYVVTFVAKEGPGKQDQKGLIQFVGKPNTTVIYPMTRAMLVELFNTVDLHLQGYLNACYQYQFQNIPNFTKES